MGGSSRQSPPSTMLLGLWFQERAIRTLASMYYTILSRLQRGFLGSHVFLPHVSRRKCETLLDFGSDSFGTLWLSPHPDDVRAQFRLPSSVPAWLPTAVSCRRFLWIVRCALIRHSNDPHCTSSCTATDRWIRTQNAFVISHHPACW